MPDYADWTESIELLGSEVMVPFDVQGAYIQVPMDLQGALIQMPVDIQGQYVDLKVDIVAQTVGSIAIDISAQSIGNLTIDVSAQTVAVKTQGEWSPQQGLQKYLTNVVSGLTSGAEAYTSYTVPTGKTLYVTHMGFTIWGVASAERDSNQIGWSRIQNATTSIDLAYIGGNGGHGIAFPTPLKIPADEVCRIYIGNGSDHDVYGWYSWGGYEI